MSIFTWVRGMWGGAALAASVGEQSSAVTASPYHDGFPTISADAAMQVSVVWACVDLLSKTLASLPLFVYFNGSNGRRDLARGSALYYLLHDSPNAYQTPSEFWGFMWMSRFLRGNGYAEILRYPDSGTARALVGLQPDSVRVVKEPDGTIWYELTEPSREVRRIEFGQMLHLRGMGGGVVGISPLDAMRQSIGLSVGAMDHTYRQLRNGGRRPENFQSDKLLSNDQREEIRNNFRDIAVGKESELYILESWAKFEPLGMSAADLQLLESRRFGVEEIARFFGVPSIMINDVDKGSSLGSSTQAVIEGFYKSTLRPELSAAEQQIRKRVFTDSDRNMFIAEFSLDALLRSSLKDRMDIYARAVQNGLKTRNECRQLENDPPIAGGDVLTAPVNLAPIDKVGAVAGGGASGTQDTQLQ